MDDLLKHLDNWEIILYVSLACIGLTILAGLVFKKHRYVKYIPGLLFIVIGIFNLYTVLGALTETQSINNISLFILLVAGGVIGLLMALIIGIYRKPTRVKQSKKNQED
ncbi:cytochrome C biosynthesis protein [Tissierella sp. Yu-01]|uniref:cytochrome C biosynthesis protein n=1 Tax=Tissierella sp. Yu-01 TaxID=3035694 RepID=UPI00240D03A8|nr:cytochrome C biosynthesis protein [Tissierella sp. Yu-01]WFA09420.1 cytochrome C biosynthesis protein [Tissierella sp. Yu-01]